MLDFSGFNTLHPLLVHIPVMMIPLAVIFLITGFFLKKAELEWARGRTRK